MRLKWPWTRKPPAAHDGDGEEPSRFHLHVEAGDCDVDAESTASSEHGHLVLPVEEPVHVEEGESAGSVVHDHAVAGSTSEESSSGESDGEQVEGGAGRPRRRGRRHDRRRRGRRTGGLPAFMAAVGPAAAVMLLALVALVAWKRRQRAGEELDGARGVP